jgi:uncharacterized protein with PIN domain
MAIRMLLHADLADVVRLRGGPVWQRELREPASLKDCLEAAGIPHTEVDLVLVEGRPADFGHLLLGHESLEAFPVPPAASEEGMRDARVEPAPDLFPDRRLQPRPLARERFLCDRHLGKLARLLRMLGVDTAYAADESEADLARHAVAEERAVLTCSRSLLMRREIGWGRLIRSRVPDEQAVEVVRRFGLASRVRLFGRCSRCNGPLVEASLQEVGARVPPRTRAWLDRYYRCRSCGQIYWEGTHVARLRRRFAAILAAAAS